MLPHFPECGVRAVFTREAIQPHAHHFTSAPLSEIRTGRTAGAAVRDGVPVPEGGGRTHLRVRGRYNGGRCSQNCPADHQAAGPHEPGGCRLLHQQAAGKRGGHGAGALDTMLSLLNLTEQFPVHLVESVPHHCASPVGHGSSDPESL